MSDSDDGAALTAGGAVDLIAALGVPVGGGLLSAIAGSLFKQIATRRAELAREILLEAMRRGNADRSLTLIERDEFVAIAYRYYRAGVEGTAKLNLRLLANVVAGQIAAASLYASEFLRWADILASLSTREIVVLGTRLAVSRERTLEAVTGEQRTAGEAQARLEAMRRLVPGPHFPTEADLDACEAALQRTGLLYPVAATWDAPQLLGLAPDAFILARLADLENVVEDVVAGR